jgi:hypothetical protein
MFGNGLKRSCHPHLNFVINRLNLTFLRLKCSLIITLVGKTLFFWLDSRTQEIFEVTSCSQRCPGFARHRIETHSCQGRLIRTFLGSQHFQFEILA